MQQVAVVDRIEGDLAVLELGGVEVLWPVGSLPAGVVEGSALRVTIELAPTEGTEAEARLERLRARTPQGDGPIEL